MKITAKAKGNLGVGKGSSTSKPGYSDRKAADAKKMGDLMQSKVQKPVKRNSRAR